MFLLKFYKDKTENKMQDDSRKKGEGPCGKKFVFEDCYVDLNFGPKHFPHWLSRK